MDGENWTRKSRSNRAPHSSSRSRARQRSAPTTSDHSHRVLGDQRPLRPPERRHAALAGGLTARRTDRLLRHPADTDERAAAVLLAAVQGGATMSRITGSTPPLRTIREAACAHLWTRAPPEPSVPDPRPLAVNGA
ncbi:hypothetical protein [Actinacidiphila sp. bgisy160]|uniref:hypothetical protein n=1 Tax=Actinacidiphila sp. bgisy160 TaxID=3413796 RepID=UPI003D753AAA